MLTVGAVITFVAAHWNEFVVAGGLIFAAVRANATKEALKLALKLVAEVAAQELSNTEKRQWVVDQLYSLLPIWVTKALSKQQVEWIAEQAYQLSKASLKESTSLKENK